jgi:HJR/Mrr/RecB family endonuclease
MGDVIGAIVVFILIISWALSKSQDSTVGRKVQRWFEGAKEGSTLRKTNTSKSLEERNEDIVQKHLAKLSSSSSRPYYIDNSVRDCIQDIAEAEGHRSMAPNYAYLSRWIQTATPDYKTLAKSLEKRFREQQRILTQEKERKEKARFEKLKIDYGDWVKQFYQITERKVSVIDDYGDESWDVLDKEIDILILKIAKKEGHTDEQFREWKKRKYKTSSWVYGVPHEYVELARFLRESFAEYHQKQKEQPLEEIDYSKMGGVEFEGYLARLLQQNGFTGVRGTPTTGDQGADLLANKDGKKIVIQAKRYEGTVGNKAVQEVASAVSFYAADEGWVITNSRFTKSAKELAQKTGIHLVDGFELARFSEKYSAGL